MYEAQDCAKSPGPMVGRGINTAASAPPTVQMFIQENDRLIKEAHEAITQLENKLQPILPRTEGAVGNGAAMAPPTTPANSEIAATLRDQGEFISGIIRRLNSLRYAVDLQ